MRYAPFQVKNPTSKHHLVRLLPDQELTVVLTRPEYQNAQVVIKGDFIILEQDTADFSNSCRRLRFRQRAFMPTACFLGEINIIGSPVAACLVIYSEAGGKVKPQQPVKKRQLSVSPITINSMRASDMESGCHVIFSRCY
jgi:hypothetical protein